MTMRQAIDVVTKLAERGVVKVLDQKVVNLSALKTIIERHRLVDAWKAFCVKAGRADPIGLN